MSRKVVKEERKEQIIEGLFKCLQKKPFNETSIKDIAAEAGVNHGVLHYYFKSKEDILLNFIDHMFNKHTTNFFKYYKRIKKEKLKDEDVVKKLFLFMNEITFNKKLAKVFVEIWELGIYNKKVKKKINTFYNEWYELIISLVTPYLKNMGKDEKEKAEDISISMLAFHEGISLFIHIFKKDKERYLRVVKKFHENIIEDIFE